MSGFPDGPANTIAGMVNHLYIGDACAGPKPGGIALPGNVGLAAAACQRSRHRVLVVAPAIRIYPCVRHRQRPPAEALPIDMMPRHILIASPPRTRMWVRSAARPVRTALRGARRGRLGLHGPNAVATIRPWPASVVKLKASNKALQIYLIRPGLGAKPLQQVLRNQKSVR